MTILVQAPVAPAAALAAAMSAPAPALRRTPAPTPAPTPAAAPAGKIAMLSRLLTADDISLAFLPLDLTTC